MPTRGPAEGEPVRQPVQGDKPVGRGISRRDLLRGAAALAVAVPMLACGYSRLETAQQQNVYSISDFLNKLYSGGNGEPQFGAFPQNQPITVRGGAVICQNTVQEYEQSLGSNSLFNVDIYSLYDPNNPSQTAELHDTTHDVAHALNNDTFNDTPKQGSWNLNLELSIARKQVANGDAYDAQGKPEYEFVINQVAA